MDFCENLEIVAITTDKNTFLMAILIKLTLDNIFIKAKKNPRHHHHKESKQISKLSTIDAPLGVLGSGSHMATVSSDNGTFDHGLLTTPRLCDI